MPPSVLIVDNNADFRSLAATILRAEGYAVDECSDVRIAIQRATTGEYAAIVVEPSPAAGFSSLFDELAAASPGLKCVVAATTEDDPDLAGRLTAAGVFRVLRKPFTRQTLSETVRACCATAQPRP